MNKQEVFALVLLILLFFSIFQPIAVISVGNDKFPIKSGRITMLDLSEPLFESLTNSDPANQETLPEEIPTDTPEDRIAILVIAVVLFFYTGLVFFALEALGGFELGVVGGLLEIASALLGLYFVRTLRHYLMNSLGEDFATSIMSPLIDIRPGFGVYLIGGIGLARLIMYYRDLDGEESGLLLESRDKG